jgi:hypothetical protein
MARPDPGNDLTQPPPSDPHIPAEDHNRVPVPDTCWSEVERDRNSDVPSPAGQLELSIVINPNEAEPGRSGQYLPNRLELIVHLTHALGSW